MCSTNPVRVCLHHASRRFLWWFELRTRAELSARSPTSKRFSLTALPRSALAVSALRHSGLGGRARSDVLLDEAEVDVGSVIVGDNEIVADGRACMTSFVVTVSLKQTRHNPP